MDTNIENAQRRRRVLLVMPRFPFPSVSGGEKWAASLAKGLADRFEVSLFAFTVPGAETHQTALAMSLERKTFARIVLHPRPDPADNPGLPALPAIYWSDAAAKALAQTARETGAEIVHIIFSEMAAYETAFPPGLPLVYTEIDSSYLFPWKSYLRETAGFKGFFKLGEFLKARAYARGHYGRFSAATFITGTDGRDISRYLSAKFTAVTPNSVLTGDFEPPAGTPKSADEILFIGHYPHFPNEDAAVRLASGIFPRIKKEIPSASLTLAGSCPTDKVAGLGGADIKVPGTVPDVRPFLWRAAVFAAPVRYGLGTKGKILEAFAAGLPVIASPEAAAGIEKARDGEHLLTASSESEFASKAARLLKDPGLRADLAARALELVNREYSFKDVIASVSEIYGKVLNDR